MGESVKDMRRETLQNYLSMRRQELQKQINLLLVEHRAGHTHFRDTSVLDIEEMSLRDSTGAQQIALLEARTRERNQLDAALQRLADGTYGVCEDCDVPIAPRRLSALPFARRCIECQQEVELIERIVQREERDELQPTRGTFGGMR
jgi:DnaK suppressor protein